MNTVATRPLDFAPPPLTRRLRKRMRQLRKEGRSLAWIASHFGTRVSEVRKATVGVKVTVRPRTWDAAARRFV